MQQIKKIVKEIVIKIIVKELKEIDDIARHYAEMEDDSNEYKYKLFNIINAIDNFLYEYSKKWASDFNWKNLFFSCVYIKLLTTLCK